MRVISFYPGNYSGTVGLEDNLIEYGLNYHIAFNWENTDKSDFILGCLQDFPEDLLYIDIDARFKREPKLFDNGTLKHFDLAIPFWNNRLLTNTMYFKNIPKIINLVRSWHKKGDLTTVLGDWVENGQINLLTLPLEYCKIHSMEVENPVIVHRK